MTGAALPGGKLQTWEWLVSADNVDISDQGRLSRRSGFIPFFSGSRVEASFTTFDYQRMYVVDDGSLLELMQDGSAIQLKSGLSGPYRWAESNDHVFLSCSEKLQIDRARNVRNWIVPTPFGGSASQVAGSAPPGLYQLCFTHVAPDGREGGASPSLPISVVDGGISITPPMLDGHSTIIYVASRGTVFRELAVLPNGFSGQYVARQIDERFLGRELLTQFLDGLPDGVDYVAQWKGRIYGAEFLPELDQTAIWFSQSLGYHLFNLNQDFFMVPGRVLQLADADSHLIVATGQRIYLYAENALSQVAEYGVVPGQHADRGSDGKTYFWTNRGLCRAAPFENITEGRVSVAPGVKANGGVIHEHGRIRYVANLHSGGAAFNKR